MGVASITLVNDNKEGVVDLLSIHNPLVFIIEVEFIGAVEDVFYATVDSVNYICPFYSDESTLIRRFFFVADEVLRSQMDKLIEIDQSTNTIISIPNLIKIVNINFSDLVSPIGLTQPVNCVNASSDFESEGGAAMIAEYNNEGKFYVGAKTQPIYTYFYNNDADNIINGTINFDIGSNDFITAQNFVDYCVATWPSIFSEIENAAPVWIKAYPYLNIAQPSRVIITSYYASSSFYNWLNIEDSTLQNPIPPISYNASGGLASIYFVNDGTLGTKQFGFTMRHGALAGDTKTILSVTDGETKDKGFIRIKSIYNAIGTYQKTLTINSLTYSHTVKIKNWCDGDYMIKYIDRKGQFRFIPFTKFAQRSSKPIMIGDVDQFVTSLKTDTGHKRSIGYKNSDTLQLTALQLNENEITLLKDLYNSHEVYIMIGQKWLRVDVEGDNISELERKKFKDLTISVKLPQSYNITLL